MYAREVNGRTLTFGVSGKLYRNGLIMFDRETESEWSHVAGGAITGPYKGTKLTMLSALLTAWQDWKELYPRTLALSKARSPNGSESYGSDPYGGYYLSDQPGIRDPAHRDSRLPAKALVLGVLAAGGAKAYPMAALKQAPAVNDTLAGTPVLVVTEPIVQKQLDLELDTVTALAYSGAVDGRVLTFQAVDKGALLRDTETGSVWRGLTGEAIDGPLRGVSLQRLVSTTAFWFAWRDYFPQTELFEASSSPGGR